MDEMEVTPSFNGRDAALVLVLAVSAAVMIMLYKRYLQKSLAIQEALAVAAVDNEQVKHHHHTPVTTMNGKADVELHKEPSVPVIQDSETGGIVESTEGPTIKENDGQ